jgi:tetratricopeptide (TPR) repeat protein
MIVFYNLPPVHQRLAWRVTGLQAQVRRALNPPEQRVFVPQGQSDPGALATVVEATWQALQVTATSTPDLTSEQPASVTPAPSMTAAPTATATPPPTPIPEKVVLSGIVHEYQQFNNCGPANLAMALSYWGWQGDQRATRAYLRPNLEVDDKNVMPAEMVAFVQQSAGLNALARVGGDIDLLKQLVAAGFPVVIEAGHHPPKDWWMGHYLVVSGYDNGQGLFWVQDSLLNPDVPTPYAELSERWWRDFNYVYLVIYPPEREAEVMAILGPRSDETYSYQNAAQRALEEIPALQGRDQFFAWFNLGSSRVGLGDFAGAAEAYDQAFAIYQNLSEEQRPYRLMWYQTGPYEAYYATGRYQDVIDLANTTFYWVGQPVLEESYYWRGKAYAALGQTNLAVADFEKAAALNPYYEPPRTELSQLGVSAP